MQFGLMFFAGHCDGPAQQRYRTTFAFGPVGRRCGPGRDLDPRTAFRRIRRSIPESSRDECGYRRVDESH